MAEADSIKPTKECATCGALFTPRQYNQKYCCCACKDSIKATCLTCGVDYYTTRNSRGKYCSIACCASAKAKRGTRDRLRRSQGEYCRVSIKPCIGCERELVGPRPTRSWAGKFCRSCKSKLGSSIEANRDRVALMRAKAQGRKCQACGETFTPYTKAQIACSAKCHKKTDQHLHLKKLYRKAYKQTPAYKRQKRIQNQTRRARKRSNGPVDRIDPVVVFERGGWKCYLCRISTPKKLLGDVRNDRAPTLDHVIPLAEGGTHTWDNVACCCRKCNSEKSNTTYQSDLFIGNIERADSLSL